MALVATLCLGLELSVSSGQQVNMLHASCLGEMAAEHETTWHGPRRVEWAPSCEAAYLSASLCSVNSHCTASAEGTCGVPKCQS